MTYPMNTFKARKIIDKTIKELDINGAPHALRWVGYWTFDIRRAVEEMVKNLGGKVVWKDDPTKKGE